MTNRSHWANSHFKRTEVPLPNGKKYKSLKSITVQVDRISIASEQQHWLNKWMTDRSNWAKMPFQGCKIQSTLCGGKTCLENPLNLHKTIHRNKCSYCEPRWCTLNVIVNHFTKITNCYLQVLLHSIGWVLVKAV